MFKKHRIVLLLMLLVTIGSDKNTAAQITGYITKIESIDEKYGRFLIGETDKTKWVNEKPNEIVWVTFKKENLKAPGVGDQVFVKFMGLKTDKLPRHVTASSIMMLEKAPFEVGSLIKGLFEKLNYPEHYFIRQINTAGVNKESFVLLISDFNGKEMGNIKGTIYNMTIRIPNTPETCESEANSDASCME